MSTRGGRQAWWCVAAVSILLSGCATTTPFSGAERGTCYTLEEFEAALEDEKIAFLEGELRNLRAARPDGEDSVQLTPFMLREFPTMEQWRRMCARMQPGDRICEYHHHLHGKVYDGDDRTQRRGYALMRNERIIMFVHVDPWFAPAY